MADTRAPAMPDVFLKKTRSVSQLVRRFCKPPRCPRFSKFPNFQISKSEAEPKRALHDPRGARARYLAEGGVDLLASCVEARRRVDAVELRVVEHVVHLPAELKRPAAAAERDPLEERHVRVVHARHPVDVLLAVAPVPPRRASEDARVEPAREAWIRDRRIPRDHDARAVSPSRQVRS